MTFIVLFEDAPDADADIRKVKMPEHLAFLEANADRVSAAGPLFDADNRGRDGLWIVEADNVAEIEALIREDPFWPTGLRKSYAIIEWTRVFADGRRLI
ncbi:MAG: YciI family protein [Pseudomonadota bacterium]